MDKIAFMANKATTGGQSAEVTILCRKIRNHFSRIDRTEVTNIAMFSKGINKALEPNLD